MKSNFKKFYYEKHANTGISAGERGQDYIQTQHDVKVTVNRLNEKYRTRNGGSDIIYFEERTDREIRLAQRLAFFGASDILLITAPRLYFRNCNKHLRSLT